METHSIIVRGAREHNLRDVNLELPRNRLIVFTGVSGSGKSSLAFDTLYAEGQRRYVESLSSYARQFMGQLPKPDVDYLGGLAPSISIQQKSASRNPRSTVGTVTEIYDYLRVLYARIGQGHCPDCGRPITAQSREQIIDRILALPEGSRCLILAPMARGQKGEYRDLFADLLRRGFVRARVDGRVVHLTDDLKLDRNVKHDIEVVVDRLRIGGTQRTRIAEAVEQALEHGKGNLIVAVETSEVSPFPQPVPRRQRGEKTADKLGGSETSAGSFEDIVLSAHYACVHCNKSYEPPSPQMFSFNSPQGMCLECDGLGIRHEFVEELLIPDPGASLWQGAIPLLGPIRLMGKWRRHIYEGVADTLGIDLRKPWKQLSEQHRRWLLYGSGDRHITFAYHGRHGVFKHGGKWEGIIPQLLSNFKKAHSGPYRAMMEKYMRIGVCSACQGQRLNPQARAVRVGGKTLLEVCAMPVGDLADWFAHLGERLTPVEMRIAEEVIKEIRGRLQFLLDVGLHYLSLDRPAPTLSGGEAQRIRLAGQIGSGLVGVLYILDEPSIGLHPRDNERLLRSLERLRDMGNTVLVVEHDEETMRRADFIVDFGPGPGVRGGEVVAAGSFDEIVSNPNSLTGQYLSGAKQIAVPSRRRRPTRKVLKVVGAAHNNLKNIDVEIPLGLFVAVTGVSGSGKSSLVNDIILEGLRKHFSEREASASRSGEQEASASRSGEREASASRYSDDNHGDDEEDLTLHIVGKHKKLLGTQHLDKVIAIDQSPIGRTPRSNPATYIKVLDEIRNLLAKLPHAQVRGYKPGRFSFNVPGGRCEACQGNGSTRLEMDFLADVWVTCPVCEGRRFNRETLQVRFKDKNIHDILEMDVQQALEHFADVPKIQAMLQTLHDVGLDYIKLGQPSPTLSGGEAQRIKLARELCRKSTGNTLYILDEPTTGLHFDDIQKLLKVLHGFVEQGNTVLVIEHNLDVIKTADWVIDLGPEGGAEGGYVVAVGTPEQIAECPKSYTGQALRPVLGKENKRKTASGERKASASRSLDTNGTNGNGAITHITVEGAAQHNLKHINVAIPREAMTVFCGPSGSGKSSLAIDTIYAEGQRRYVESLSAYARQFLGRIEKPKVDHISGLSPAICIEQKSTSKSPRSTVGTVTEIHDYLRVLYARLGQPYCPRCDIPIGTQTADEIIDKVLSLPEGSRIYVLAPVERKGQEKYEVLWEEIRRTGFVRLRVDGVTYSVEQPPDIDQRRKHVVEVVIDRLVVRSNQRGRIADAVEAGLELGKGVVRVAIVEDGVPEPKWKVEQFSQHLACSQCGRSFEPLNPHHFSFNSPLGWCPACEGLGFQTGADPNLFIRDPKLSLREGAIAAWPSLEDNPTFARFIEALAGHVGFSLDTPFGDLTPDQQSVIFYGTGADWIPLRTQPQSPKRKGKTVESEPSVLFQYKGLLTALDEATRISPAFRQKFDAIVTEVPCHRCGGSRLREDAAAMRFQGYTLGRLGDLPLQEALALFENLQLPKEQAKVAGDLLREIRSRLRFLVDVGLEYLTLNRPAPTLSGGEAQRIRLASQIGSGLTGVLYVLDEPTIGLHPRDNQRLIRALTHLRDLGNTLLVVEHDREVIATADHLLDFGPGAGDQGGEIVAQGPPAEVRKAPSLTGEYLDGRKAIPVPTNRRVGQDLGVGDREANASRSPEPGTEASRSPGAGANASRSPTAEANASRSPKAEADDFRSPERGHDTLNSLGHLRAPLAESLLTKALIVRGARHNNLKNIDVAFPLGCLIAVTGVSGSGKSSLVNDVLYNTLARRLHRARTPLGRHDDIEGLEHIDKVINVDQTPLGNTPTSNPATYTGVFNLIRRLFAQLPESRVRGWQPRRFSFNQPGGRCEACEGMGQKRIEMHFLPDVWIECDVCHGSRYNPETLQVRYKGKNIADVLNLRVGQALELFENIPSIRRVLQTLADVGLDYLALGQPAPTLSGGEAQRVKLAAELARPNTGRTVYILDEPTTGLHFDDVRKLLDVLHRLVDLGNTVIVVEHNLDVIKTADWVIDIGPEAGEAGGYVVAAGTPEAVAAEKRSHTGRFLAPVLKAGPHAERPRYDPRKAEEAREGDVEIEQIGSDVRMPWEVDGRRWHTVERVSRSGKPCRWDGKCLEYVVDLIQELGDFAPTNWNDRTIVEIAPPGANGLWFFHASTWDEWFLWLKFRVGNRTFEQKALEKQLGILPPNQTPGLETYGDFPRVQVKPVRGGAWQGVEIAVHSLKEVQTKEFQRFVAEAVVSFEQTLRRLRTKPSDVMPWKVDGRRWHIGDWRHKGFPPGKQPAWEPSVLDRLLAHVSEALPQVEFDWQQRDAVHLRLDGKLWGRIKTKDPEAVDFRFVVPKGRFNLTHLEGLGHRRDILNDKPNRDVVVLRFRSLAEVKPEVLRKLLLGARNSPGH
ncbi:MAG: excinuclease ABC subunit UvrA [Gemmatales bacterium]|nr:excinuclease ABC subunit UvrA [Gemmatales bacterium]MDW8388328.1 excinuclease ABC subunit UvrA [Gemmatales bacterium]